MKYVQDIMNWVQLYRQQYQPTPEIQAKVEAIDLDYIAEDLLKILNSMAMGTERIRNIVLSLRNFSRLDESDMKLVDIHEGLESTRLILRVRLKANQERPTIQVIKEYGAVPLVECYAGLLNQVFMNIIANAIDALDEYSQSRAYEENQVNVSTIRIRTEVVNGDSIAISIADNGPGITAEAKQRLFDVFFTTKPVGKGTGIGLSISYQIVTEKHRGQLYCMSELGNGAEFIIEIPLRQQKALAS